MFDNGEREGRDGGDVELDDGVKAERDNGVSSKEATILLVMSHPSVKAPSTRHADASTCVLEYVWGSLAQDPCEGREPRWGKVHDRDVLSEE